MVLFKIVNQCFVIVKRHVFVKEMPSINLQQVMLPPKSISVYFILSKIYYVIEYNRI